MIHARIVLCFAFLAIAAVNAAPVTFNFTGSVTQVPVDEVFGDIGFGAPITGSFTFDSTTSDGAPADNSTGSYTQSGAGYVFTVNVGGHVFSAGGSVNVAVFNAVVDQYSVLGQDVDLTLRILLQDDTAAVFATDALPLAAPSLASFLTKEFHLESIINGGQIQYDGVIETLTGGSAAAIPEPSTAMLTLAAAALFLYIAGRRNLPVR